MTISNRLFRGFAAFMLALVVALLALAILGFLVPGLIMEQIWGPWENQSLGSGLLLAIFFSIVGVPGFLVTTWMLTTRFYKKLQGNLMKEQIYETSNKAFDTDSPKGGAPTS